MVANLKICIFSFSAGSVISRSETPILSESKRVTIVSEFVHLNHLYLLRNCASFYSLWQWHPYCFWVVC